MHKYCAKCKRLRPHYRKGAKHYCTECGNEHRFIKPFKSKIKNGRGPNER